MPDEEQLEVLQQQQTTLFILDGSGRCWSSARGTPLPFQPNYHLPHKNTTLNQVDRSLLAIHSKLTWPQTEKELFANLSQKLAANVQTRNQKGVEVVEIRHSRRHAAVCQNPLRNKPRAGFYAHAPEYFQTMWESMGSSGMLGILRSKILKVPALPVGVMFLLNDRLYYPHGASIDAHREVMASNLMLWEMIRFGKTPKLQGGFDLWVHSDQMRKKSPLVWFHRFQGWLWWWHYGIPR